jgi:ribosomal protein S18 acetylase RimI-like enzyme
MSDGTNQWRRLALTFFHIEESRVLSFDPWLSGLLGKPAYHLSMHASPHGEPLRELAPGPAFVDAKVPTGDLADVRLLESSGFRIVDVSVQLAADTQSIPRLDRPEIDFANAGDEDGVAAIAEKSFIFDRFHADPLTSPAAGAVKREWARNFFRGKRGTWMVVARQRVGVVGFLQLLRVKANLVVDLIAVTEGARGCGLGQAMISFAARHCGPFERVEVGTQVTNAPSLRLYEGLGFRAHSSQYVLHCHRGLA